MSSESAEGSSDLHQAQGRVPLMANWAPVMELGSGTKYAAVAAAIAKGVDDGALMPGTRLPPQREIAEYFNVTIATVTKAIDLATRNGLVIARAGSGTYINQKGSQAPFKPTHVDLSLNAPPAELTAQLLQESLQHTASSAEATSLFDYEPVPGSANNRAAGCAWMALRDHVVSPEQVLITHGAHEGLIVSLLALTEPGDSVLCEELNYAGLRRIGQMLRLKLVGIAVDEEGMVTDQVAGLIAKHRPKVIVCTPATHNPTSATLSHQRRLKLIESAKAASVPIIEDDIYGLLAGPESPPLAALWPEGVVLVTSLSKTVSAGMRVGYVVAPKTLTLPLRDAMLMLAWTEPSLQASMAAHLIGSGAAQQCVAIHRAEAQRRIDVALRTLGPFMFKPQSPTYHVWVDTGSTRPDDIAIALYRQGIQVSPGSHFSVDGSLAPMALRISLGRVPSMQALESALQTVGRHLRSNRPAGLGNIV